MSPLDPAGPRVVAVGGGHGLAATLRAVRRFAGQVTAVVSVADDGGSTGRLRAIRERPAPGDLRKCLVALAGNETLLTRTLDHRFAEGDLRGHALGNLLIAALEEESGDLVAAVDQVAALVGAVGRVLPATNQSVQLVGETESGDVIRGQVEVMSTEGIVRVGLEPADAPAPADAIAALRAAELIVLGPGSLFTSVLAAVSVPAVLAALAERSDRCVYVCNLRAQPGETAGYRLADHEAALRRHGVTPRTVLFDPDRWGADEAGERGIAARLSSDGATHDPELLAHALQCVLHSWR